MLRSGGRVLCGTDAPIDFLAVSLHLNLRAMVKYGLTPYEALLTTTRFPGEFLDEPLGIIAPGALADLLLVEGDPLARIEDAAAVRQVMKNGELFTLDELIGPFAGSPGAATDAEQTLASSAHTSSAPLYWWHEGSYVEQSRAACCASHLSPITPIPTHEPA
jgi:adenine deaminase